MKYEKILNIEENNGLIAEFMGTPVKFYKEDEKTGLFDSDGNPDTVSYDCKLAIINNLIYEPDRLGYHTSWNWLMPVIEKIEKCLNEAVIFHIKDSRSYLELDTQASLAYNLPDLPECYSGFCETKIKAAYCSVIQFIHWYNSQTIWLIN